MECTCKIKREVSPLPPIIGENLTLSIVKCPLCTASLEMYEALKGLCVAYNIDEHNIILNQDPEYWQRAIKALRHAEGKTND